MVFDSKTCVTCNKSFIPKRKRDRVCSEACKTRKCKFCSSPFNFGPGKKGDKQEFCSAGCGTKWRVENVKHNLICSWCGTAFQAPFKRAKYCSNTCKCKFNISKLPERACKGCNKQYKPSNRYQRYCNASCATTWSEVERMVTCLDCDVEFIHKGRGKRYYCTDCMKVRRSQQEYNYQVKVDKILNPGYKGGPKPKKHVYSRNYRKRCFKLWEKKCVICGCENYIQVHHIDGVPSNNSQENLIPLCLPCHLSKVHKGHDGSKQALEARLFELWPNGRFKIAEKTGISHVDNPM